MSLSNIFFAKDQRSLKAKNNITISFITKFISIAISFIVVPLTLNYVGSEEYGLWIAISSIINWFAFFDVGLGNGLRNKLAEAIALKKYNLARVYVSSVYFIISIISFFLFLGFLLIAYILPWNVVLNTNILTNNELFNIVCTVFFLFCFGFILKLISSILAAQQRYALNDIMGVSSQFLGFIGLYFLVNFTEGSLFNLCFVYGVKTIIIMSISTILLFSNSLKNLKPSIKLVEFKRVTPLLKLSAEFFFNQILFLLFTKSSLMLVIQFFGPEDVTVYSLAFRYSTIISMGYIMILNPYLSAFTEAYTMKEFDWIKSTIKKIQIIWFCSSILGAISFFIYTWFFKIWVGDHITVPSTLMIVLILSAIINMWSNTYTLFLNAIGKIRLQSYILILNSILFVPLFYTFYSFDYGLPSIVFSQLILYSLSAIIFTFQYYKVISSNALGIWGK